MKEFIFLKLSFFKGFISNKTKQKEEDETEETDDAKIETTTTEIESVSANPEDNIDINENTVDEDIAELQIKVKLLQERGNKIRDAIIEQTKLLLSDESALSDLRTKMLIRGLKQKQSDVINSSDGLSSKQEAFFKDLIALENLLRILSSTDKSVMKKLVERRKKNRKPKQQQRIVEDDRSDDSILSHPTITGLNDPFNDDYDEDIPTIIVAEDGDDPVIISEYEVDLDPEPRDQILAVPVVPDVPHPHDHDHIPHHGRGSGYSYQHHHRYYPQYHQRQHYGKPHQYGHPMHYQHHYPQEQYYHDFPPPAPLPPPSHFPDHHASLHHPPVHHSEPLPPHHPHPASHHHEPVPLYPEPEYFRSAPPPEPHITLTGELLRGFENIGRGFH